MGTLRPSWRHGGEGQRFRGPDRHLELVDLTALLAYERLEGNLDEVELTHAHPSRGEDGVAAPHALSEHSRDRSLLVATNTEVDAHEPVTLECCQQPLAVRVADLARPERRRDVRELIAGRDDADPRPWVDGHGLGVDTRKQ